MTKPRTFTKKWILLILIVFVILIQFIRIDKNNPEVIKANDFIYLKNPPQEISHILKSSCYDCHSNETKYPWYTNVAPVSWWIKHHITEGREHLNFSEWNSYPKKKANHKLEECYEQVEIDEMPVYSYTLLHPEAKLTPGDKEKLMRWLRAQGNM